MKPKQRVELSTIKDYIPGRSIQSVKAQYNLTNIIKMASNENPLGPAVSFKQLEASFTADASYYPDISQTELLNQLCKLYNSKQANIVVGNGSDDILQMIALAYLTHDDDVITSEHSFSVYTQLTAVMGANLIKTPMTNYTYSLENIKASITDKTKIIFIANPNNPTGTMLLDEDIRNFVSNIPKTIVVVIDEAYIDFSDNKTDYNWRLNTPNVITTRTFSKMYGLAGLRIGYAVATETLIANLNKVRQPFTVNNIAVTAASKALTNNAFVVKTNTLVKEGLAYFYEECDKMGLSYLQSDANFICIFLPDSAASCFDALCKKGVIIRALTSFGLDKAIRVTIGLPEHNTRVMNELKEFLK